MRKKKFIFIIIVCAINILCVNVSYGSYLDGTGTSTTSPYAPGQEIIEKEEDSGTGYISGGGSSIGQELIDKAKEEVEKTESDKGESNEEEKKENEKNSEKSESQSSGETVDVLGNLDSFKPSDGSSITFDKAINNVVYILQVVGSIVSVIALVVIGIKYMCGSIEQKAEYKKTMVPYIVGAVMVFGISFLTGLIYNLAKNVF